MNCPAVLAYRVSLATELVARVVTAGMTLRFAGLVNIIAERLVMPELLQRQFTTYEAASWLLTFLRPTVERKRLLAAYQEVREKLGEGGATARAAKAIAEELA